MIPAIWFLQYFRLKRYRVSKLSSEKSIGKLFTYLGKSLRLIFLWKPDPDGHCSFTRFFFMHHTQNTNCRSSNFTWNGNVTVRIVGKSQFYVKRQKETGKNHIRTCAQKLSCYFFDFSLLALFKIVAWLRKHNTMDGKTQICTVVTKSPILSIKKMN